MTLYSRIFSYLMYFLIGIFLIRWNSALSYMLVFWAIYALMEGRKTELCIFSLLTMAAYTVTSPVILPKSADWFIAIRIALLLFAVVLLIRKAPRSSLSKSFTWLYVYLGYMALVSLIGWMPLISELKILLFVVFLLAFVHAVQLASVKKMDFLNVRAFLLAVASFFLLGSILVVPFPIISKSMLLERAHLDGDVIGAVAVQGLFNGVTWHSQTLGPIVAIFNTAVLADYLFNERKEKWLYRTLLIAAPIVVYLTSSRTALAAYLVSIFSTLFFFFTAKRISEQKKARIAVFSFLFLMIIIPIIALKANIRNDFEAFIRKSGSVEQLDRGEALSDSVMNSRMGLVEAGLKNFKEALVFGNGFQVSKSMKGLAIEHWQMLLSAPVEKGVLWIAILEEGGVIGALIFILFLVSIFRFMLRKKYYCFLSCFSVLLALNSGEAIFFSSSGAGGFIWSVTFFSLLFDIEREQTVAARKESFL